jgi:serine/threonine-protein kinase RsbW
MTMSDSQEIRMQIAARLESVFLVGLAVRGICTATSLSEIEIYGVEAAVVEAVNNAVKHAYRCQPDRELDIRLSLSSSRIEIQVRDRGNSMATLKFCEREFDVQDRGNLPESGLGLPIIHHNMDDVVYETLDGVNVLTMRKYFSTGREKGA